MQRGVIVFTNPELKVLHDLLISSGHRDLIVKLSPVQTQPVADKSFSSNVLMSKEEVETVLDLMEAPDKDDDPVLVSARIKLQNFK